MKPPNALVHCLAVLFGISAWIAINGLWQQTPILVNQLPEAWNLASYITLITQLANIGPLLYSLLKRLITNENLERTAIHLINWVGILALILQIFFWSSITPIAGHPHSLAFLLLTFFLAIVDCTSSVLYIPYMTSLSSNFLVSHLVGQSLSGLIPSFLALVQGVGGNPDCILVNGTLTPSYRSPRFSVNVFFGLLTLIALLSWIAFFLLDNLERFFGVSVSGSGSTSADRLQSYGTADEINKDPEVERSKDSNYLTQKGIALLLVTEAAICCFTNGVLPSIQPYSVLVYGNVAYHFVVSLSAISSASGTYLSSYLNRRQSIVLPIVLAIATSSAGYILASAKASPNRLISSAFGSVFIVLVWMVNNCCFAFSRATIMRLLRSQKQSHRALYLGGVFTQVGSAIGAIVMFGVINYTESFKSFQACSGSAEV